MRGDIKQANGFFGNFLCGLLRCCHLFTLPADTSQSRARKFITAQAGEAPGDSQRPDKFERVELPARVGWQITGFKIQSRPHELGPDGVGDDPWVRSGQCSDTARSGKGARGIKATHDPFPFLTIMEEGADSGDVARF